MASKARTTSGGSQSSGSKSASTDRHYLYIEIRAPQCRVLGMYLVKDTLHPQKLIFTIAVWESWVWFHSRFYFQCSAVRQEWWVNTWWCPMLIVIAVPLMFLGQGEMNGNDSCEASSEPSTASFAVGWRSMGGQHKILPEREKWTLLDLQFSCNRLWSYLDIAAVVLDWQRDTAGFVGQVILFHIHF